MPGWGNSFTQPIANRIEMLSTGVRLPVAVKVFGSKLDEIQRVSQEIAGVLRDGPRRGRRLPRSDHRQGLCRDPHRPQEGGPLRDQRRRRPGRRRDRDGRAARDADRRGPRALPGPRPLRPRLPRRRGGAQEHPRLGPRDGGRCPTGPGYDRRPDGQPPSVGRTRRLDAGPAGRRGRYPRGGGAVDDQERERPAAGLRPVPRPRPRRGGIHRGGAARRGGEGAAPPAARDVSSNGRGHSSTRSGRRRPCGSSSPRSSP